MHTTAQIAETLGTGPLEPGRVEAVAEEARSHDDVLSSNELELAPRFTPEELDFSDYRWSRGDHRSQRDVETEDRGMGRQFR